MNDIIADMVQKSGLGFLEDIEFEEKSRGRFFQKEKVDAGGGWKQFYVILGPNVESPVHNHAGENMDETHFLLHGSGRFLVYDEDGGVEKVIELEQERFHPVFSTADSCPDHKYIAGPEGSIVLALEKHH